MRVDDVSRRPRYSGGARPPSIGRRVLAWFVDSAIVGLAGGAFLLLALVVGALGPNGLAIDQMRLVPQTDSQMDASGVHPFQLVSAPLLHSNGLLVALILLAYVGFAGFYYAGSWTKLGATPGQRLMGLSVAQASGRRRLTASGALSRWFWLSGFGASLSLASVSAAIVILSATDWLSRTPTNAWLSTPASTVGSVLSNGLAIPWMTAYLAGYVWSSVLLVSTHMNRSKRGLHDLLSGSEIVSNGVPEKVTH